MKTKQLITQAINQGEKYYVTGKPCKNGHLSKRNVKNGNCYACQLEKKRFRYMRKNVKIMAVRSAIAMPI